MIFMLPVVITSTVAVHTYAQAERDPELLDSTSVEAISTESLSQNALVSDAQTSELRFEPLP
ncbi:MAG: hypothetical protein AAFZ17_04665 [Cyanobacteria bacterium J06650_10]